MMRNVALAFVSRCLGLVVCGMFMGVPYPAQAQACTNPSGAEGDVIYNSSFDVFQGCAPTGWKAFHEPLVVPPPTGPTGCPNVGNVCTGSNAGIIYAGEYLGNKLYVTGTDAPGTVVTGGTGSGTYSWNAGSGSSYFDLDNASMPNCPTGPVRNGNRYSNQSNPACQGGQGRDFTTYLANFAGTGSPYRAASYCYHLGKASDPSGPANPLAHGRSDWYLPSIDELEFIYDNLGPHPKHGFQNEYYWTSTENRNDLAWLLHFDTGDQEFYYYKQHGQRVRCVAR